jgi:hypothetical protein
MIFKKLFTTKDSSIKEVQAVQTWVVSWYSRYGSYSGDVSKEFEVFTDLAIAEQFQKDLEAAFSLIRHTSGTSVVLKKN